MDNNTILVIDDDRNILAIIELYLKKAMKIDYFADEEWIREQVNRG